MKSIESKHAVADFPVDNKYKLGQLVCLKKTGVMYHVVGMSLYLGYNFCLWTYTLAKPTYSDSTVGNGPWKYARTDVDMIRDAKEIDIISAEEAYTQQKKQLQDKIKATQDELNRLLSIKDAH